MTKIELTVPDEQVAELDATMRLAKLTSYEDLLRNALTLFSWAVGHTRQGRVIGAVDVATKEYLELDMPCLGNDPANDPELSGVAKNFYTDLYHHAQAGTLHDFVRAINSYDPAKATAPVLHKIDLSDLMGAKQSATAPIWGALTQSAEQIVEQRILDELADGKQHGIRALTDRIMQANGLGFESDIKAALIRLIRRNQLDLSADLKTVRKCEQP